MSSTYPLVLGIETSCDETGVAIYGGKAPSLLADCLYSQIDLHAKYGGVVPELASRDHVQKIIPLINQCINQAHLVINDIDAIAYTSGPGLNGALLVGAGVANSLAFSLNKPVIPIHHLEGHLLSAFLSDTPPTTPFVALLVSGGHSQLILVNNIGSYQVMGDTLDDAAGEAFDKSAKMLGLPYPGGKYIAELAINGVDLYKLPRPMEHSQNLAMSFSGLKTAVAVLINKLGGVDNIDYQTKCNIAKAVEEAITDILVSKSKAALKASNCNNLVICGGVSANLTLRHKLANLAGVNLYYPPLKYCTDNGAMIAISGYMRYKFAKYDYSFQVSPRYLLSSLTAL